MNRFCAVVVTLVVGSFSLISASDEWLHGKVTDVDGKAISGALIWFDNSEATALTDENGIYKFDESVPVHFSQKKLLTETGQAAFLKNNSIFFNVTGRPATVRLEIVDLAGRCVRRVVNDFLSPKSYSFVLPLNGIPASTYIVSLKIGAANFSWRVLVQENGALQIGRQTASACLSNRIRAAEDASIVVHCTREYYERIDTTISSFKGEVNFIMNSRYGIKRPPVEMRGGDTVRYAVQNSNGWLKFWDTDTLKSQIIFDTMEYILHPITQTLIDTGISSFTFINYKITSWDGQTDTTVTRLLVLFDSMVTKDTEAPVITLKPDTIRLTKGDLFDLKDNMTITDEVDSHIDLMYFVKITDNIRTTTDRIDTQINFDVPGTYTVTYEVIDTHMNRAKATRIVIVTKPSGSGS